MVYYGGMSRLLGMFGIFILSAYISVFYGLAGMIIGRISEHRLIALILIPSVWVTKDLILEKLFGGFPWEFAGYSQYKNTLMIQLSEIGGVHFITFLIIFINVLLFFLIKYKKRKYLIALIITIVSVYSAGFFLDRYDRSFETNISYNAAGIIQPNTGQNISGHSNRKRISLNDLFVESRKLEQKGAEFVIWPEYSIGLAPLQNKFIYNRFDDFSMNHIPLFAGFTDYQSSEEMYNSIMLFDRGYFQKYDKYRLVPFGEYIPFKKLLFFINKITDEISDFTAGKKIFNLKVLGNKVSTPICYEIIYPRIVRDFIWKGGKAIILISNDSWYGTTSAPYQLLSMSVFRSIENRRYLLRSTSNGISAIIDPRGKIIKKVPLNTEDSFVSEFKFRNRITFYTKIGFIFPYLTALFVLIFLIRSRIKKDQ